MSHVLCVCVCVEQALQVSVESVTGAWSEAVSIDEVGTSVRGVERASHTATLVVRVRHLTNVLTQVSWAPSYRNYFPSE